MQLQAIFFGMIRNNSTNDFDCRYNILQGIELFRSSNGKTKIKIHQEGGGAERIGDTSGIKYLYLFRWTATIASKMNSTKRITTVWLRRYRGCPSSIGTRSLGAEN